MTSSAQALQIRRQGVARVEARRETPSCEMTPPSVGGGAFGDAAECWSGSWGLDALTGKPREITGALRA